MPRPTKRTPTAQQRIVQALRLGATYLRASQAAGISYDTLNDWMRADLQFSDACKKAEAERALQALRIIQRSANKDNWQAAAWYLERRYPEEYGRIIQEQQGEQTLRVTYDHDWRIVRPGAGRTITVLPEPSKDEGEATG